MRRLSILFVTIPLAIACSQSKAQAAAASTSHEATSIHVMSSNGVALTPVYQDAKGKLIDAQAFAEATQKGLQFKMKPSPERKTVILELLPPGAKSGSSLATTSRSSLDLGKTLPAFRLQTVANGPVNTTTLAGQRTLVDFFFADCVACIEELPALNAFAAQHPNMHFLAVTFDDAKTAKGFVRKRHFGWPVAYAGMPLIKKLAITSFPTMFLLDAKGRLLANHSGSIPVSFTRSGASSAEALPSEHDPSWGKKAQLQWLGHWVDKSLSAGPN